ncbi:18634_t:CDS:10 [Entrophospora sp. SA101]|nr:18634_t:CDS:10 [Entrophospora sp. SA101]
MFNELGNQNIYININNNNNKITNANSSNSSSNTNGNNEYGHYDDYIKTMIKSIKELGLYDSFKYAFLENSRKFFHEKSQSYRPLIENRNIGTYLKLIKQQIEFEIDKVTYFFGEELYIKESSVKIMINEYYLRHMDIIIKKGMSIYTFEKNIYNSHIIFSPQKSLKINKENLQTLSQLNRKFKNIQSNEKYSNIINMWNKNFISFVNEKKDNITNFYKPYFMKHYKKKFAKRLLYHHDDKNFNLSNEEWILSLFNRANIIDNLYGMIKDIHESIGIKKDFDIFNHLKVTILTGSYWPKFITGPSPEVADLKIPYELFLMRKSFQDYFYCKRRDGANRNLKWLHSYDNLIISLIHPKGKMYFSINMCMFIILEMFNYTRSYQISYTIREIMKNTELVLKSALSSLIFGEIKLLNKFVNSKRLNLSDAIFINENLNFIESTVDNPIIIDERKSQRQISTSEDVQISSYNISNEIRIDSRIMKLMKLHKRYQHNSLISFIQKDFKNNFHQQVQIKSLIKRQFLRNEGKNVVYVP